MSTILWNDPKEKRRIAARKRYAAKKAEFVKLNPEYVGRRGKNQTQGPKQRPLTIEERTLKAKETRARKMGKGYMYKMTNDQRAAVTAMKKRHKGEILALHRSMARPG